MVEGFMDERCVVCDGKRRDCGMNCFFQAQLGKPKSMDLPNWMKRYKE